MPDPISGVVGAVSVGGSLLSSSNNSRAIDNATEAQTDASTQEIALARETRDLIRSDNEPFRDLELQRANALGEVFGFNPAADAAPQQQQPQQQPQNFGSFLNGADFGGFRAGGQFAPGGQQVTNTGDSQLPFTNGIVSNEGVPTNGINTAAQSTSLDRFEGSPFGEIFTNNFGLETDAIDAGLAGQGLNLSSVRTEAKEDARQRNFGSAFGNYFNALSGFPTSGAATTANANAAQNFSNTAGGAFGDIGQATANGAFASAQNSNALLNNLGGSFGSILGGF